MELDNKIIAEKLNALQDLPGDYHPNLDAKWELIEKGTDRKRVFFFNNSIKWMSIAACLLLLCGLAWLWMPVNTQIVEKNNNRPKRNQDVKSNEQVQELPILRSEKRKAIHLNKAKFENNIVEQPIANALLPDPNELTDTISIAESTVAEKIISKKKRYYQLDFDAAPAVEETAYKTPAFKLQVGSKSCNFPQSTNNSPLKLNRTF